MKKFLISTVCTLLLAPVPASAKSCKGRTVTGDAMKATSVMIVSEANAKSAAVNHWVNRCNSRYGGDWCYYPIAADRDMRCNRVASGIGTFNWTCTFKARPCRN